MPDCGFLLETINTDKNIKYACEHVRVFILFWLLGCWQGLKLIYYTYQFVM